MAGQDSVGGPSPSGGGPAVFADEVMTLLLQAVEELDLPLTVRQVEGLAVAVRPLLERAVPPVEAPARPAAQGGRPMVPAGPTLAAVQELLASGWPLDRQATEAGITAWSMSHLPRRTVVEAVTEVKVLEAAARLRGLDPLACGVPARSVARARNEAARRASAAAA